MNRWVNCLLFTSFLCNAYAQDTPSMQPSIIENTFANRNQNQQQIDLDLRSRPTFRHDDAIMPEEFRDNDPDGPNGHLPKAMTHGQMHQILLDAIMQENIQVLKRLRVERDVDLNILDGSDNSLLDYAIQNKKYQSIKFLIYNEAISNHDLTDYLGMAIDQQDVTLLKTIQDFNIFEKFNERHFIHAFSWHANDEILFVIYDALDPKEKYNLLNYYAGKYNVSGLAYMAKHGYDLNRTLFSGDPILIHAVRTMQFTEAESLMLLEKYFSHDHIYHAYLLMSQTSDEALVQAPKLATYGLKYDLQNDIRDRQYVLAKHKQLQQYHPNATSDDVKWLEVSVDEIEPAPKNHTETTPTPEPAPASTIKHNDPYHSFWNEHNHHIKTVDPIANEPSTAPSNNDDDMQADDYHEFWAGKHERPTVHHEPFQHPRHTHESIADESHEHDENYDNFWQK